MVGSTSGGRRPAHHAQLRAEAGQGRHGGQGDERGLYCWIARPRNWAESVLRVRELLAKVVLVAMFVLARGRGERLPRRRRVSRQYNVISGACRQFEFELHGHLMSRRVSVGGFATCHFVGGGENSLKVHVDVFLGGAR